MTDNELLYFGVLLIYLVESICWLDRDSYAFIRKNSGSYKFVSKTSKSIFGNDNGIFFISSILPSNITPIKSSRPPIEIHSKHVLGSYINKFDSILKDDEKRIEKIYYKDMHDIQRDNKELNVNGKPFCTCSNNEHAEFIMSQLKYIIGGDDFEVRAECSKRLLWDSTRLDHELIRINKHTKPLFLISVIQFYLIFVFSPIAVTLIGSNLLLLCILMVLINHVFIVTIFYRCHHLLFKNESKSCLNDLLKISLCPPLGIKSVDILLSKFFYGFHPLLLAKKTLTVDDFVKFRLTYAEDSKNDLLNSDVLSIGNFTHHTYNNKSLHYISKLGIQKPKRDLQSKSYCSKCLSQFVADTRTCPDCNIRLTMFGNYDE